MELTWWGTAGFRIKTGQEVILLDPYLSRNSQAQPKQYLTPQGIQEGDTIFISHGHFDHLLDIPALVKKTGAKVYCSKDVARTLLEKGTQAGKIHEVSADGFKTESHGVEAEAFFSEHVIFDRALLAKTLWRTKWQIFRHLKLFNEYPAGQVLSWRFKVEDQIIHFFGSGGSPADEMEKLASKKTDILLVPLQGHSDICNIALEYVHVMQPTVVIPHHQDDFYPPISQAVDISSFVAGVKQECPNTEVKIMEINETIIL